MAVARTILPSQIVLKCEIKIRVLRLVICTQGEEIRQEVFVPLLKTCSFKNTFSLILGTLA